MVHPPESYRRLRTREEQPEPQNTRINRLPSLSDVVGGYIVEPATIRRFGRVSNVLGLYTATKQVPLFAALYPPQHRDHGRHRAQILLL
jgi:hypothetical protein